MTSEQPSNYLPSPEESISIMCSVLNLVFDHSMEDPTPMEPEEYHRTRKQPQPKQQQPQQQPEQQEEEDLPIPLKVPVIRIFGPLLRDAKIGPLQSACLHIHGAFPYLLARPVMAGPDGSFLRRNLLLPTTNTTTNTNTNTNFIEGGQIDWDNPLSVERITESLQSTLEDAIQALDMERLLREENNQGHNGNLVAPKKSNEKKKKNSPVIRKISVVQGRGFFTYCPGPPAPFLKIEYYDPKLRWKVKLMLERGLQVPLAYHPDPTQYGHDDDEHMDEIPDVLKFNCYEAHIPYSMQVFKDWNLAGMSYLHIQRGKIRSSLREIPIIKYRIKSFDLEQDNPAVFLKVNTPTRYLWDGKGQEDDDYSYHYYHDPDFPSPPKVTNSDVEIDCTVYDLRNIDSVLKTLPTAEEERDRIQWRAVPSLQEIWRQERRRMAKLLSPEKDFLTPHPRDSTQKGYDPQPPPFTLNVKEGSERSGTRLACKGMRSLVRLTYGLEEEFDRALQQILQRHQKVIQQMDHDLIHHHHHHQRHPPNAKTSTTLKVTPAKGTTTIQNDDDDDVSNNKKKKNDVVLTPNFDDAIHALSSLGDGGSGRARRRPPKIPRTPSLGDAMNALVSMFHAGDDDDGNDDDGKKPPIMETPHHRLEPMKEDVVKEDTNSSREGTTSTTRIDRRESQISAILPWSHYPSSSQKERLQAATEEVVEGHHFIDPAYLSQRVDRGDSIFHDGGIDEDNFEECINPETLLPYEHWDFGVTRCRVCFTVDTDPVGIQRICGNHRSSCRRDGHQGFHDKDRIPPGCYKTISTGVFVDGIFDSTNVVYHDEEEDGKAFEKALDVMRVAIPNTQAAPDDDDRLVDTVSQLMRHKKGRRQSYGTQDWGGRLPTEVERPASPVVMDRHEDGSDSEREVEKGLSSSMPTKEYLRPASSSHSSPVQSKDINPPESFPSWISPVRLHAPSRHSVATTPNGNLYPMMSSTTTTTTICGVPFWLKRISRWNKSSSMALDSLSRQSAYVQPTRLPPTRRLLISWCKKKTGLGGAVTRKQTVPIQKEIMPALQIDSNSRKVVAFAHGHSVDATKTGGLDGGGHIEEAVWEPSQTWQQLSMTQQQQQSQGENMVVMELPPAQRLDTKEEVVKETTQFGESTPGVSSSDRSNSQTSSNPDPLEGIGAQGGRIHVQGGGTLKTRTRSTPKTPNKENVESNHDKAISSAAVVLPVDPLPAPISFMSVEIHVQCRTGVSRLDSKRISMSPDSSKDKIFSIVYVYGIDPGDGESLQVLERCCLFVKFEHETSEKAFLAKTMEASLPHSNLGTTALLHVECLDSEKKLLLRFSSLVTSRDPDMLLSWDPQSAGLGYMIDRTLVLNKNLESSKDQQSVEQLTTKPTAIDFVRLLGRTPFMASLPSSVTNEKNETSLADMDGPPKFKGSGLGADWDERVGAGTAAASIVGRLVFAGWKIVAEEVKHPNYSYLPAVTAAVLNKRIPQHDDLTLTQWYSMPSERWRVMNHRLNQAMATMLLFDALDIVGRAGEAARLSGVEFSQSFPGIRGSQYKVEGVLLRALQSLRSDERGSKEGRKILTTTTTTPRQKSSNAGSSNSGGVSASKPRRDDFRSQSQSPWKIRRGMVSDSTTLNNEDRHYFFFSPSKEDSDRQEALEVQALTLEPESGHYTDPVVVCDFTALYPSLVIAYNLCYSTCAGKLEYHSTREEMQIEGKTTGRLGPFKYPERRTATVLNYHFKSIEGNRSTDEGSKTEKANDRGYIAPTGTLYVAEDTLKGVLPQVLDEILTTRAMLKRASKEYKKNVKNLSPAILRQLEARQLALKYVANVTYGYTSATFSGRCAMPLLADTIVECGRKTLRKAINMANAWGREGKWKGARVIYGDTDSLFVRLPGRSYTEAFDFGEELCKAVTADNPPPVQLKLEKVYSGSIMQTMKRYCGMKFESKNNRKPQFEAKGLETVRRDQCALTQKVLRNALITLFRHGIDAVHDYLNRQWYLISAGHIPVSDFILTGRVRSQYRGGREGPVQAVLAQRLAEADPGNVVRNKERIPYVIVATPGKKFKLKDCVLTPLELLERWDGYTIHSAYYIERHVNAALARCLSLAPHHIDVHEWYRACPKPRRRFHFWPVRSMSRTTIDMHFGSDRCSLCQTKCKVNGRAKVVVCPTCQEDQIRSTQLALSNLNLVQQAAKELAKECANCNGCFEDSDSFASLTYPDSSNQRRKGIKSMVDGAISDEHLWIPLANCVCIDCPNTFKRHHLRGQLIESAGTCEVLGLLDDKQPNIIESIHELQSDEEDAMITGMTKDNSVDTITERTKRAK